MQEPLSENTVRSSVPKAVEAVLEAAKRDRLGKLVKRLKQDGSISESELARRVEWAERSLKHGQYGTRTYHCWRGMMHRCFNVRAREYPQYGGRGITVCPEWRTFIGFFQDMGECPPHKSIDRINNHGNYEPSNCRWATYQQQNQNSRQNVLLTFKGETLCVTEWARRLNVGCARLFSRVKAGWPVQKILSPNVSYCAGVDCHKSKLTVEDVLAIRASCLSSSALSSIYHMTPQNIWRIKQRRSYKNIP